MNGGGKIYVNWMNLLKEEDDDDVDGSDGGGEEIRKEIINFKKNGQVAPKRIF